QGNTGAQVSIGWAYGNGLGVARDNAEAMRWYRKAADQGNAEAPEDCQEFRAEVGHDRKKGAQRCRDAKTLVSPTLFSTSCWLAPKGPLFRTIGWGTGKLTRTVLPQANAYAMIGRRAAAAGIGTKLGNHSFRATGITAYLKNGGTLEKAAAMANHASTRTTQLYDRRRDELSLDEVERIAI